MIMKMMKHLFRLKEMLRWAGGKQKCLGSIIPKITALIKDPFENNNIYFEPFLGSGAVLIELLKQNLHFDKYICSDINRNLIITFNQVKLNVDDLIEELDKIQDIWNLLDNDRKEMFYYTKRDEYNDIIDSDEYIRISTLFIFLNRTSFRGLYQLNKRGKYNVPYGKKEHLRIVQEDKLRFLSDLFNEFNVEFRNCEYVDLLKELDDYSDCNKVIYLDPPYYNTFDKYTKERFDCGSFLDFVMNLRKLDCKIVLSNSIEFKKFLEQYQLFEIIESISIQDRVNSTHPEKVRYELLAYP